MHLFFLTTSFRWNLKGTKFRFLKSHILLKTCTSAKHLQGGSAGAAIFICRDIKDRTKRRGGGGGFSLTNAMCLSSTPLRHHLFRRYFVQSYRHSNWKCFSILFVFYHELKMVLLATNPLTISRFMKDRHGRLLFVYSARQGHGCVYLTVFWGEVCCRLFFRRNTSNKSWPK